MCGGVVLRLFAVVYVNRYFLIHHLNLHIIAEKLSQKGKGE